MRLQRQVLEWLMTGLGIAILTAVIVGGALGLFLIAEWLVDWFRELIKEN